MTEYFPPLPSTDTVVKTAKVYAKDLTERVATTFLEGFVGGLVITQPLNLSMWHAAAGGGVASVVSLAKGLLARWRSVSNSASLAKGV
jgi:hypothetical protein